jgi:ADP-heptose:LPS heptosyltransferase/predicted SAM-dependent methyltransferase
MWRATDPEGSESKKICWEVAPYLRGRGVDLGAGTFKILPQAISVDSGDHAAKFGHPFMADLNMDCEKLTLFASQSLDFVYSSHLLEHIEDYKGALKEWWRVVKQGGVLALYLPHKDFYPNIGQPGSNPTHKHDFLPSDIIQAMELAASKDNAFDLVECQDRNDDCEYSMLLVFKKQTGKNAYSYKTPASEKTVLVCRFGAFGDLMQASSVFAGLKKQGYHVTLMTSEPGVDVVKHDPNIDKFMILDRDQIPNANLGDFWEYQAKKYDKFVNLSESVEGTFLAMPGRTLHKFPPALRHKLLDYNYVEVQHDIAGVPHDPQIKFYATPEEKAWARKTRAKMGDIVVMWSLAGSSVHKTWSGLDQIIALLMINYKNVDVVLVGGPECVMLEAGWEKEKHVHLTCGKWSIRESLSFIDECDVLIGPETGVLNAAANVDIPKIVFLSHSSVENLTRDWLHTTSLWSSGTQCKGRGCDKAPACHLMHFGWEHCTKNEETGTAQCMTDISTDEVAHHMKHLIDIRLKMKGLKAA